MKRLFQKRPQFSWAKAAWRNFASASPARRVLIASGLGTFVAGMALLGVGIVGVFDGGSNPAESHVPRLGEDVDLKLRETPTAVPTEEPTQPPTATPQPEPPLPQDGYRLVIDKLGVNHTVDTYGLDENAIPVVPTGDDAAEAIAWYDFSARPGIGGNAVFAGHNSWFGDAVFTYLHQLEAGDVIRLEADDGTALVYTVSDVFSVAADDPEALAVMRQTETDVITLITCGGSFVDTDDPVFGGEFTDRVVVRADLTSVVEPAVSSGG